MKKKEIKKTKLKPRKKAEVKRDQYTVVLEDVRRQFGVMKEGFSGVNKRLDDLDKKVDDNHRELRAFRNETNDNFKVSFEYLSKIDDELQLLKIEIADLKTKLKGKAELKRLMQVEKRMVVAEKQLETMIF